MSMTKKMPTDSSASLLLIFAASNGNLNITALEKVRSSMSRFPSKSLVCDIADQTRV